MKTYVVVVDENPSSYLGAISTDSYSWAPRKHAMRLGRNDAIHTATKLKRLMACCPCERCKNHGAKIQIFPLNGGSPIGVEI